MRARGLAHKTGMTGGRRTSQARTREIEREEMAAQTLELHRANNIRCAGEAGKGGTHRRIKKGREQQCSNKGESKRVRAQTTLHVLTSDQWRSLLSSKKLGRPLFFSFFPRFPVAIRKVFWCLFALLSDQVLNLFLPELVGWFSLVNVG